MSNGHSGFGFVAFAVLGVCEIWFRRVRYISTIF